MKRISFSKQVAIVTGSGRGIGRSYALELARRGASVVVNDIGESERPGKSRAQSVVDEISSAGGRAVASEHNVTTIKGGQAITDLAMERFGSVDIVINNAGFLRRGMFDDLPPKHVKQVIGVHLLGAFYVTQPAWKHMKRNAYGRVVLTSSAASFGMQGNSNYVAAKAGLLGLVAALSLEGADHGIKVNGILPLARSMITVDSPATAVSAPDAAANVAIQRELGDRATLEAVAAATLYLASDQCSISGHSISAVAGRYSRTFLGVTEGWLSPDVAGVTLEDFRDNLAEVIDSSAVTEVKSMSDEYASVLDRVNELARHQS
ncbi:NAD(P)-dependent dehydrogenase, short-chain alcohol dehydrogenase family [Rhizobiales bacterium GAS188]|nr:NAD(P)-dependent dehydrogenase, short-chain alcohol dehydrogenase family [Rhizobiales bacterium GAS188]